MTWQNYIYSKTFDYFLILPMKTGTVTASWIFTYFDFYTITRNFDDQGNYKEFPNAAMSAVHSFYLPPEISDPKIIVTARNPYDKMLSRFLFGWTKELTPTPLDFENYILTSIEKQNHTVTFPNEIKPTYIIHSENLYEDYLKIPFVENSNLNKSGVLKEILSKKINEGRIKVNKPDYLTDKNKELIYSFLKNQFELFGYEK